MQISERGFIHGDDIPSAYGGYIKVYESSAASAPHIWVRTVCPSNLNDLTSTPIEAVAHLTLDDAARLRDQLSYLIANHYQESE
jgi:hypothetical protein